MCGTQLGLIPLVSVDQIYCAPCVTRLGRALLTHAGALSTHHILKTCLPKQTRGINAEKSGGCGFIVTNHRRTAQERARDVSAALLCRRQPAQ